MNIKGLSPDTERLFEHISKLESIKDYTLVGGTALSLQLQTRLSEDLDFMQWKDSGNNEVQWKAIKDELSKLGEVETDVLDFKQVLFQLDNVKLSFYIRDSYPPPGLESTPFLNNIKLADVESIGVMKMNAIMRRSNFRDYYDIYSIIKQGGNLENIITKAAKYADHSFKTRSFMAALSNGNRFTDNRSFEKLNLSYQVSSKEIEEYFKNAFGHTFVRGEIPFEQLKEFGLSAKDFQEKDINNLLKGEKTDVMSLKIKDKTLQGRFSLQKEGNTINFLFHQATK